MNLTRLNDMKTLTVLAAIREYELANDVALDPIVEFGHYANCITTARFTIVVDTDADVDTILAGLKF